MRRDLKLTLMIAPVIAVPLFFALAFFWNPHGDSGPLVVVAIVGLLPYMLVVSELRSTFGVAAFPVAVLAQLCWSGILVFCAIRVYRAVRYLTTESP